MNIEQARENMIEQQIRPWNVFDESVLTLLRRTPRELFVPEGYKSFAFSDIAVPIGSEQVMMTPKEEGRLLQLVDVQPHEVVLEVGTGSGYLTALLAQAAKHVVTVDILDSFTNAAKEKLQSLDIDNVTYETADASNGFSQHAPYDVIVITGSLHQLPEAFKNDLNEHGRIFCVLGQAPNMTATVLTKLSEHDWHEESFYETQLPRLVNAKEPEAFLF